MTTINLPDHYKGDTFDGVQFTMVDTLTNLPINLTGVTIKIEFRRNGPGGSVAKTLIVGDGITITDAVNGLFQIDAFLINWSAATYCYDIQFSFAGGNERTYIKGAITINQDVTVK